MKIPFVDLEAQYLSIKPEIDLALRKIVESGRFILGEEVELFEKEFADYYGTKYCIALNSGTSALHLSLLANNIGPGDEVITQPNTFFATCEAISYIGARPVFVDINPDDHTIDVSKIERVITKRTKAIIPVHLFGNPTDMDSLMKIAKKNNLVVIEDSAQAHGVSYKKKKLGSFGNTGCFSFYPTKVLGAYGEAGAVATSDKKIEKKIRMLRDHGQSKKYYHKFIGYNYRMDGFQGAVLRVKLKRLDDWVSKRRSNAKLYNFLLKGSGVITPPARLLVISNFQYYVIRCKKRNALKDYLIRNGVSALIHYPVPIHLENSYKHLGYKEGDFPITEKYAKEILTLPMYSELEKSQIKYIADLVKRFYREKKQK